MMKPARDRPPEQQPPCTQPQHKGWHSRGYLPHMDGASLTQFLTFRLADAVPRALVRRWKRELAQQPEPVTPPEQARALRHRVERYADVGRGACHLQDPANARIVRDALTHFDGQRYRLLAWCIMPNHVHVLISLVDSSPPLSRIVRSWKSFSARQINANTGRSGALWMPDYFDRYVRDQSHLDACMHYIRQNPVKAGLVDDADDWPWTG